MKKRRILSGIGFIGIAVLLLLNAFGYLGNISIWKILFGLLFASIFVKSVFYRSWTGVFFSIAFLCWIFDHELGITDLTPWTVLAVAFCLSLGCHFLFGSKKHNSYHGEYYSNSTKHFNDSELWLETTFGESIKYVESSDFQNADIRCCFGGMKVYFDKAVVLNQANVYVDVSFGTIQLYVPREWQVISTANTMFGSVEESGSFATTATTPILYIEGRVQFGDVEVIYI